MEVTNQYHETKNKNKKLNEPERRQGIKTKTNVF